MKKILFVSAILIGLSISTGYANSDSETHGMQMTCTPPDLSHSYIKSGMVPLPDSKTLLSAPGATVMASDEIVSLNSIEMTGAKRLALAAQDADLSFPNAAGTFSCALKAPITEKDSPHLNKLLLWSLVDASHSTDSAKKAYNRKRPFMVNHGETCRPCDEDYLKTSGSYPSGHSAIGWAWALILSEIAPDRADDILKRGLAFGESRVICNVHWESDVIAGRIMGAATVARLHAVKEFQEDLDKAKKELAAVRKKGLPPQRDCAAEAEALGQ
jgi:acid phosphatase (class A)